MINVSNISEENVFTLIRDYGTVRILMDLLVSE